MNPIFKPGATRLEAFALTVATPFMKLMDLGVDSYEKAVKVYKSNRKDINEGRIMKAVKDCPNCNVPAGKEYLVIQTWNTPSDNQQLITDIKRYCCEPHGEEILTYYNLS